MIDLEPATAQRLYAQGVALQQHGRLADAMTDWRNALMVDPCHADARYNLAVALAVAGDAAGAERNYTQLLSFRPGHRGALYNLANLKMRQGDAVAAEPLYRRLLAVDPNFAGGWVNLAMALSARDNFPEAESCLRTALALEPGHVVAHCNLAHLLLAARRWSEGWREFEWRLRRRDCPPPPARAREWAADDVNARSVLLWIDQGLGDALQFMRYVPLVAARGHKVFLFVQDALKRLAGTVPGVAGVYGASDPAPESDAQAPLLSMPYRLGLADPTACWRGPYVTPPRAMGLSRRPGRRAIGLVWRSNPAHPHAARRDVPLKLLEPLIALDGIDWFSLQVGPGAHEIAVAGLDGRIHDLSPALHDFADTAAAVMALDLVISVDTSVMHLVGAMGKPGWAMISTAREWRWAGRRTTSPWYPSLRLFHQDMAGDWSGVVAAMAAALRTADAAAGAAGVAA